ncbi:NAD-dependent epimerase/dehydratase family protein [Micromonospora chaiyaphumensis]|uniref:Nucleoside-diphosphate-sugar epimerase n=1 Tax=Micromonospora chaiyaphumensis TaxID=307119 RepID=A0A1C4VZE8_9ACTN|nr:NAD(P)-dependent oxidoreductase [Micromonospora chaiyaphumensis]SCE89337.1 Nucleoside-diphosphate-sugar epimerase [Micromonospora chaiyaphumensis]
MNRPRAVVVGATGFLGRHVRSALATAGWEAVAAARRPEGPRRVTLPPAGPLRHVLAPALRDLAPTLVVNAAGLIWRPEPAAMAVANAEVPEQIALALADSAAPARLVHLGSCLEYAPVPPPAAIDERTPTRPESPYGRSKLEGSRRLGAVAAAHGLDVVELRVFNAIGPGMSPASVLGAALDALQAARDRGGRAELRLLNLRQHRDYVDARDVADAVVAAATAAVGDDRTLNVGSGVARSAEEVVRALALASGVGHDLRLVPAPAGAARAAGASWQLADIRRARAVLGWSPRRSLSRTVRDVWASADADDPTPRDSRREKASRHD